MYNQIKGFYIDSIKNKLKKTKIIINVIIILMLFIFIISLLIYLLNFHGGFSKKQSDWGDFGSYIGGILSGFIAPITIIVLSFTIIQQYENQIYNIIQVYDQLINFDKQKREEKKQFQIQIETQKKQFEKTLEVNKAKTQLEILVSYIQHLQIDLNKFFDIYDIHSADRLSILNGKDHLKQELSMYFENLYQLILDYKKIKEIISFNYFDYILTSIKSRYDIFIKGLKEMRIIDKNIYDEFSNI